VLLPHKIGEKEYAQSIDDFIPCLFADLKAYQVWSPFAVLSKGKGHCFLPSGRGRQISLKMILL